MTRRQNRVFVSLKLPESIPELLIFARVILESCAKHPLLKNPVPSLIELVVLLSALEDAQTAVGLGGLGKRSARDAAADALRQGLGLLGKCVEVQANRDMLHAEAFIGAAFMTTRAASSRRKLEFTVKPGRVSGTVVVEVIAIDSNASYMWQCSFDDGKTWVVVKGTKQSKTTLTGLPVGKYVQFRCRRMGRDNAPHLTGAITFLIK